MKERLLDPKIISETRDPKGREEVLTAVSSAESELQAVKEKIPLHEARKNEIAKRLSELEKEAEETVAVLADRLKTLVVRLKIKLGFEDSVASGLGERKEAVDTEKQELLKELGEIEVEIENLKAKLKDAPAPQELLDAYHEKMMELPLTNEEKREFLKPEILASLSTEEYIQLWRRLNPQYLSHATRQGFRDHNFMTMHSAGLMEFQNGFTGILQDDKSLSTPFATQGLRDRSPESVRKFLENNDVLNQPDRQTAEKKALDLLTLTMASAGKFADKTAVHLGSQVVLDRFYGGEQGNEIFFVFPTDAIASQYDFAGPKDLTKGDNDQYNDTFVWPPDVNNPGINIDTGLAFIPEHTQVDPETGSSYACKKVVVDGKESKQLIPDEKKLEAFSQWAQALEENSPIIANFKKRIASSSFDMVQIYARDCAASLKSAMEEMGFDATTIGAAGEKFLFAIANSTIKELTPETLNSFVKKLGTVNVRPEKTVSAREYWEKYFTDHPEQRPKHIVYYDGDPSTTITNFQRKNKIGNADTSETDGPSLGFDDRRVPECDKDPRSNIGRTELEAEIKKVIEQTYK